MKAASFFFWYLVLFIIFAIAGKNWFDGANAIRYLLSFLVAGVILVVAFGIIDTLLPRKKDKA